jgi:polyvinyl alcohol dehydrogenase (cytochrome)
VPLRSSRFILVLALLGVAVTGAQVASAAGRALPASRAEVQRAAVSSWPMAGHDLSNTRNNPSETTIGTANVAGLVQKWSATFPSNLTATPAVVGGVVYLGDRAGTLWAFNATTGAVIWSHLVSSYTGVSGDVVKATPAVAGGRVIVGDQPGSGAHAGASIIAVSAATGALLWKTVVDTTPTARITGAAGIDGSSVYVGVSSADESSPACCTFRGSVVALNASTGALLWRRYTAPAGYTGAAVWGGNPVVNHTTGLLYIGTGNNYTVPAGVCTMPNQTGCTAPANNDYVDSLVALHLSTGTVAWAMRTLSSDATSNVCPSGCGPDFDFGSAPNLFTATIGGVSRQLVGIGQKSGIYWARDAATGAAVWQTLVGPGGTEGGIQWGSAVDGKRIYVSIGNSENTTWTLHPSGATTTGGAFSALNPATGAILWQTPDPQKARDIGFVSSANGVVYAGSDEGSGNNMYALNGATGKILWKFASGGAVMGGAAVVNGTVYWETGYIRPQCPTKPPTCGTTFRLYAFGL